ncbi:MgtC/SapB family protein [Sphingomonas sinipercae]|uniref:MgtC/SapB family protein n=1 Tax=Sphingomonas sinipercae TaxID=2714944 RepID=A0A6G7ZNW7_9SPHN|nr:DUF4010 domain-containing protein [Sphingomonas sinipercae]QIL02596.1 MgtC/SapB family protein [Sphingomonas sinipercae]
MLNGWPDWAVEALAVATALACGLLVGIERGWNLRKLRDNSRFAGIRTFTLLGLGSGIAGLLGASGQALAGGGIAAAAAALVVVGYSRRTGDDKMDATTPVAALVTVGLGFLAGGGRPGLAIAGATLVTLVLALREEAHRFIDRLDEADVKALARFAVIAGAVLPFLPSGDFGPYGAWNPQKLWMVVVLVTGFSFAGYVANRLFGARHGTVATALIGGLYSSTAVTQSLSQRLGSGKGGGAEPAGIALASTVMYLRVIVLVAVLATRFLVEFTLLVVPALLTQAAAAYWLYRKAPTHQGPAPPGNPIALLPALGFVAFVAVAAVAAAWAQGRFGQEGLAVLLLVMGSMDVDVAIVTAGGLPADAIAPWLASMALAGTILANMAVKLGIVIAYARREGRSAAISLAASMVVLALTIGAAWTLL